MYCNDRETYKHGGNMKTLIVSTLMVLFIAGCGTDLTSQETVKILEDCKVTLNESRSLSATIVNLLQEERSGQDYLENRQYCKEVLSYGCEKDSYGVCVRSR